MKSLLTLASLMVVSLAAGADSSPTAFPAHSQVSSGIAPGPGVNLYSAGPVPEPSHAMLLMIGILALTARRRR